MALGEKLKSFVKGVRKGKKIKLHGVTRPLQRVVSMTDVLQNIEERGLGYQSFETDSIPSPLPTLFQSTDDTYERLFDNILDENDARPFETLEKTGDDFVHSQRSSRQKSCISLLCGIRTYIDLRKAGKSKVDKDKIKYNKTTAKNLEERHKDFSYKETKECNDSEESCSSVDARHHTTHTAHSAELDTNIIGHTRSCDDIFNADGDEIDSTGCLSLSTNDLFQLTSIQENALKISRRRHEKIRRRRSHEVVMSDSESDLICGHQKLSKPTVRFSGLDDTCNAEIKSVSMTEIYRTNSIQLKAWQIRRKRRDKKQRIKRQSRSLELIVNKNDISFENTF